MACLNATTASPCKQAFILTGLPWSAPRFRSRNYSNHTALYNAFCVLLMAFCGSKLHHSHSSSSHCCQSISILWPEGTAGWLLELRERSPPAKQHAESAENLAFNKHIKSSPFVYGGGSLRLESYFLFHFAECFEVTYRFHSVLHRGVTEEDRTVTYGVWSAEQN